MKIEEVRRLHSLEVWTVELMHLFGSSTLEHLHMTSRRNAFDDYKQLMKSEKVGLGDGRTGEVMGVGTVKVMMKISWKVNRAATLYNVLQVPKLTAKLVRSATDHSRIVQFGHTRCWIKDSNGKVKAMGTRKDKLFHLDCDSLINESATLTINLNLWHQRLGNLNQTTLKKLQQDDVVSRINITASELSFCQGCTEGKATRKPFKSVEIRST